MDKDTDLTNFFAKDGMLKELTKNIFERALKAEMDEHLGYSVIAKIKSPRCAKKIRHSSR